MSCISVNPKLNAQTIQSLCKNPLSVFCYDTIDSTNNEAKRHTEISATPTLFVANHQSAGRGRLGRSFYSPTDTGLYMSLLLCAHSDTSDIVCMTTAASVCVCEALMQMFGITPAIKWVNDIYVQDKKICGILCEAVTNTDTGSIDAFIIGIGININTASFPQELRHIAGAIGQAADRNRLCAVICDNIIDMYKDIKSRSFVKRYKQLSLVLGKEITYTEQGITKSATAVDIDQNGGLVIQTEHGTQTLSTGEITVRLKND